MNWAYYQISEQIQEAGIAPEDVLIAIIDADTKLDNNYFEKVNMAFNHDAKLTGLQSKVRVANLIKDASQDLEFSQCDTDVSDFDQYSCFWWKWTVL